MGSWHVGAHPITEVPLGWIFEWRQRWRVAVRDATKETSQEDRDGKDRSKSKSETGAKGFERRSTNLEVILNAQRDSESEQHSDVDMVGADSGANGGSCCVRSFCWYRGDVCDRRKEESSKRRMERIQLALTRLGSGDDLKDVREKLNQEMFGAPTPRERH